MKFKNLIELVLYHLPFGVDHNEFLRSVSGQAGGNTTSALAAALRACPGINWPAYMENNPDVVETGRDPVEHFLTDGIYEGRKIYGWPKFKDISAASAAPKVSIIVPNFNNAIFLHNTLPSLLGQTLPDIEIIVVDDASSDNSLVIIDKFARADNRLKVIRLPRNQGTHHARKTGVAAARGDYIMFVDSDDTLVPDACEKAWNTAARGYDIVSFNANIINHGRLTEKDMIFYEKIFNSLPVGEYSINEVLKKAFVEKTMPHNVAFRLFSREIAQKSFESLVDDHLLFAEDLYEFLAIVNNSRNFIKIPDRLYNYAFKVGISAGGKPEKELNLIAGRHDLLRVLKEWCEGHGRDSIYNAVEHNLNLATFQSLPLVEGEVARKYFQMLLDHFGPLKTAINLMEIFHERWNEVSTKIKFIPGKFPLEKPVKKIGIFYFRALGGGIETTMGNMIRAFRQNNYEVHLFLEEMHESDEQIDPSVKIHYLSPSSNSAPNMAKHLTSLYMACKNSQIDLMFHMWIHEPPFLWDNLLLNLLDIPVIGSLRFDHNLELLYRGRAYSLNTFLNSIRSLAKVFCLTVSSEIYLRAQGIDAVYLPNAARRWETPIPAKKEDNYIAVIGRLHDDKKQILQCQYILQEVLKYCPDAKMIFIGGFEHPNKERLFWSRTERLNLKEHIEVTGWTNNPSIFFDRCKLFLYTSFMEGFPNGIAEAQARALPGVMYNLDIMMSIGNPSIVSVPQGDIKTAAVKIAEILLDDKLRARLAETAFSVANQFTLQRFEKEIVDLARTFDKQSVYRPYSDMEYRTAIKAMAFYAGKGIPAY